MSRFKWLGWPNIRLKMYKAEKNYPEPIDCVSLLLVCRCHRYRPSVVAVIIVVTADALNIVVPRPFPLYGNWG